MKYCPVCKEKEWTKKIYNRFKAETELRKCTMREICRACGHEHNRKTEYKMKCDECSTAMELQDKHKSYYTYTKYDIVSIYVCPNCNKTKGIKE